MRGPALGVVACTLLFLLPVESMAKPVGVAAAPGAGTLWLGGGVTHTLPIRQLTEASQPFAAPGVFVSHGAGAGALARFLAPCGGRVAGFIPPNGILFFASESAARRLDGRRLDGIARVSTLPAPAKVSGGVGGASLCSTGRDCVTALEVIVTGAAECGQGADARAASMLQRAAEGYTERRLVNQLRVLNTRVSVEPVVFFKSPSVAAAGETTCLSSRMEMCRFTATMTIEMGGNTGTSILEKAVLQVAGLPSVAHVGAAASDVPSNKYARDSVVNHGTIGATLPSSSNPVGQGVIGVADTGLDVESCFFADSRPVPFDTVDPSSHRILVMYNTTYGDRSDQGVGGGHGTHVCGTLAGAARLGPTGHDKCPAEYDGVAAGTKLAVMDISDGRQARLNTPADLSELFSPMRHAGARVVSGSFGTAVNEYTAAARSVDEFMTQHRDTLVVLAAGNYGYCGASTIQSPATCKNAIAVGATGSALESFIEECKLRGSPADIRRCIEAVRGGSPDYLQEVAEFSSRGPAAGGRSKPDLMAIGHPLWSSSTSDAASPIRPLHGTSQAAPVVAATAQLARQILNERGADTGADTLKAFLIASARSAGRRSSVKGDEFDRGHGRAVISLGSSWWNGRGTADQGSVESWCFRIANATFPLGVSVALVWLDPPAYPAATNVLVNDLDLRYDVIAPNGTVLQSPRAVADIVNPTEAIDLPMHSGTDVLRLTVYGARVPVPHQDFALLLMPAASSAEARELPSDKCPVAARCPAECGGHGTCTDAGCVCDDGWAGSDCSASECVGGCRNGGSCLGGVCNCTKGFVGLSCESAAIKLQPGSEAVPVAIPAFGWSYVTIEVPKAAAGLRMSLQSTGGESVPIKIVAQRGRTPTIVDNLLPRPLIPLGEDAELIIPNVEAGIYNVGIYAPSNGARPQECERDALVEAALMEDLECPKGCSGHGVCTVDPSIAGPFCRCDDMWADEPDCSIHVKCARYSLEYCDVVRFETPMVGISEKEIVEADKAEGQGFESELGKVSDRCLRLAKTMHCLELWKKCSEDSAVPVCRELCEDTLRECDGNAMVQGWLGRACSELPPRDLAECQYPTIRGWSGAR